MQESILSLVSSKSFIVSGRTFKSFGEGNGNPLQYSCLENPMDREAWCPWGRKELDTTERLHVHVKSLIHFEFIFVSGFKKYSSFTLLHVAIQFSQHHLPKRLSFLVVYSCLLCQR